MPRILEPGQIEALAQRSIPRIRLPDRAEFFAARGRRLRQLAETGAPGHTIGDYLRLMAVVADAQQLAIRSFDAPAPAAHELVRSHTHRMPVIHASSWPRARNWRELVDRKSTRLNSSHVAISYAVFCLKKKKNNAMMHRE